MQLGPPGVPPGMQLGQPQLGQPAVLGMHQQLPPGQFAYQAAPGQPQTYSDLPVCGRKISTSVGTVLKVPKCHQLDAIAMVDPKLDSTLTGKCDADEVCVILWLLTRIRPNFKIPDLRCEYYEQLFEKYKQAADRIKDLA